MNKIRSLIAAAATFAAAPAFAGECREDVVYVKSNGSELRFQIEIADSPGERSRGLMFRESMPRQFGMLFVYEHPQRAAFWMKNTLIPLDMIFMDKTGTVTRLHHRAIPGDLTPIEGGDAVYSVLEINGGLAETYGIEPGSVMQHEVFSNGPAAWPC